MQSAGAPSTPSGKVPLKGLFRNGVWHCNCIPRLPAVLLQVKKDTANKGRSFYTCQKDRGRENRCNFFLWAEEASMREMGAVLSNSRSEDETPSQKPKRQRTLHESITPSKERRPWYEKTPVTSLADLDRVISSGPSATATATSSTIRASSVWETSDNPDDVNMITSFGEGGEPAHTSDDNSSAGSKRKRPDVDEYSDFSSGEEEALVALADSSAKASQDKHRNAFETPAPNRTHLIENGMATPLTGKSVRRVLFADPEVSNSKRQRTNGGFTGTVSSPNSQQKQAYALSPSTTPSSSQETPRSKDSANIAKEVMSLLNGQKIDAQVLRSVRSALDRHATRAKGVERGRDASREAIKKAEGRIAELQQQIADLENQKRLDAESRNKMRADLMKLYRES
ncbi:hypothetical protein AAE478_000905 [Parahypoxylon ruwenzoriense]